MTRVSLSNLDLRLVKAAVYGANDGIIIIFAVVAGVAATAAYALGFSVDQLV